MTEYVYILKDRTEKDIYKIGISNNPDRRVQEINRSCKSNRFTVMYKQKLPDRKSVFQAESFLVNTFRMQKVYPFRIFDGSTEVVRLNQAQFKVIFDLFRGLTKVFKG